MCASHTGHRRSTVRIATTPAAAWLMDRSSLSRPADLVEVARQPGLGDCAVEHHLGQGVFEGFARLAKLLDVDPGLDAHRLEHEDGVFEDDVAGGAGRIGTAAEPAQGGVER